MPTYEYKCRKCGFTFECFQGIKDRLLKKCPECGGHLDRLIGGGIIFVNKKGEKNCAGPT